MSRIEADRISPTISTMYKNSQGLGISIFKLVNI